MLVAVIGWLGTAGTLVAYALLSQGRLSPASRRYAALNTTGGLLGGTACVMYGAWPSAASNLAWAALGVISLINLQRSAHSEPRDPNPDHDQPGDGRVVQPAPMGAVHAV